MIIQPEVHTLEQLIDLASATEPWTPAVPDTDAAAGRPADPYPVHVIPDAARAYVEAAAEMLARPVEMVALPYLASVGICVGRKARLRYKEGFDVRATIWGATVADSASGKTPAQEAALRPLQVLADEERDKYEAARKEYDRAREGTIVGPEPREKRYVTTDCTPQRLTQLLQHDDVLLARDELSGWVGGMDAYSKGAERQAMMQAWSGAQIRVDRRNRDGEAVVRAGFVMNVVGGIQPAMLDAMVADVGAGDDGFCARFLWAWPDVVPAPWSEARLTDQPLLKRQTCSVAYSQPRAV